MNRNALKRSALGGLGLLKNIIIRMVMLFVLVFLLLSMGSFLTWLLLT